MLIGYKMSYGVSGKLLEIHRSERCECGKLFIDGSFDKCFKFNIESYMKYGKE